MATLPTKSQASIVALIAAGMQGRVSAFLNFTVGSVLRAYAEAYSGVALWLQAIAIQNAKLTRLSTSYGSDADSWLADYGLIQRLGSQASTGLVVFSRFTPSGSAPFIPVGATVQTSDTTLTFAVYADPTNPSYFPALNGYTMPAQVASITIPVTCTLAGSAGNVAAGAISQITSSIPGVDGVVNQAAFTNGIDQESDEALKARFRLSIASLSKGTETAMQAALASLEAGIQATIRSGVDLDGTTHPGMVSVVVDDGSGAPSATFVQQCAVAISKVRAAGIRVGVFGATISLVSVTMAITTGAGYDHNTVVAQVAAAVAAGLNGTGLGNGVEYFDPVIWARAVPGCTNVSSYLLNNGTSDLAGDPRITYKAGLLAIS